MIVGVDIGTQSLKALLCDDGLEVLGVGARSYAYEVPRAGWAEQRPEAWLSALRPAIAAALADAGRHADDVRAIGLAGQLDGCVACDAEGEALAPVLIWMDRRASGSMPELDAGELLEITGQVADPSHMAAKIAWQKSSGLLAARFHQPVSFVLERLCGARLIDPGHASTTMLFDQRRGDYSERLLAAFGVSRVELPAIAAADSIAGRLDERGAELTGLRRGTAVCVGTGDDFATPLGAGIAGAGTVACVLGTAEVVGAVSGTRVLDHGALLETHNYVGARFFVENPGWLAGGALRWAIDVLGVSSEDELEALASGSEPGAGGVTFIPALTGAMAPRWVASARAAFYGMSAATTRGDLARAIYESCAFAMRDVIDRLRELDIEADAIALLGGGARSSLWAQIRADVSGLPVRGAPDLPTCALGAAVLAAVAVGVSDSIDEAVAVLAPLLPPIVPGDSLEEPYARYRELFAALAPMH